MTKFRNFVTNCREDNSSNSNHHQRLGVQWQQQQHSTFPTAGFCLKLFVLATILVNVSCAADINGPIAYRGHLSALRIEELKNMGHLIEDSVNPDKYACDGYFDYVCSRHRPLYSVLGHLPNTSEIIQLMTELQSDREHFDAKQKINDFFVACNVVKHIEDCYRETFAYFKPIFGYIITKYHIDSSSHEHQDFLDVLSGFLSQAERTEDFLRHPIRMRLATLREKFRKPHVYFRADDLNREYKDLRIYRGSYEHNLRNLDKHRKRNGTYETGIQRTMLDWTLYVFQSRNKPRSYYFATLNVHLWMTLYNTTVRYFEPRRLHEAAECLSLPQHITMLEEARILAVIYLKSFRNAWKEYEDWIRASRANLETHDQENEILRQYNYLNNNAIFFVLYAQNFCDFGRELAEHVFYIGLKQSQDFDNIYHCNKSLQPRIECVP